MDIVIKNERVKSIDQIELLTLLNSIHFLSIITHSKSFHDHGNIPLGVKLVQTVNRNLKKKPSTTTLQSEGSKKLINWLSFAISTCAK